VEIQNLSSEKPKPIRDYKKVARADLRSSCNTNRLLLQLCSEQTFQLSSGTAETGHDRANRAIQLRGSFFITKLTDIAQYNNLTADFWQLLQCCLNFYSLLSPDNRRLRTMRIGGLSATA